MPDHFRRSAYRIVTIGIISLIASACIGGENPASPSPPVTVEPASTSVPASAAPDAAANAVASSDTIVYIEVMVLGEGGDVEFSAPNHLALDADDNLYVTEFVGGRVWVFSATGVLLLQFAGAGDGIGELSGPTGIALDANGNIYVGESGTSRVQKFSPEGVPVASWGTPGSGPGEFASAMGVAINDDLGRAYVADYGNSRVQVFTLDGELLFMFGERGDAPGEMFLPIGVDIGPDGTVYVVDSGNSRVQTYTSEGNFIEVFSTSPLAAPQVISVREDGSFWVAGPADSEVVHFSSAGEQLASLIPPDGALRRPHGTETASDGTVWLADTGNNLVRAFRIAG